MPAQRSIPSLRLVTALLAVALAGGSVTGCSSTSSTQSAKTSGTVGTVTPAGPACPVGRWHVTAQQEFAQMGLGALTSGVVTATGGVIRISFTADHRYTFTYDRVRLRLGEGSGAGTAAVNGPVTGTWTLNGDRLTTSTATSGITVDVNVSGATVPPSQNLNRALRSGIPGTVRVRCTPGALTAMVVSGAVAGRQVTFAAG